VFYDRARIDAIGAAIGCVRERDKSQRGGSVMIGVKDAPAMVEQLAERRVFVDSRPSAGLRMSPHFFNTDEEVAEALNILAELIER
jgi:kynureninase